ncbi:phosphoglucosamine mutase [Flavipsychrobacter stenotrophus]|uniref:Phosphoglucosamine mutase n=1 Tax=Flavipsychrobacter stenotrophus TaxID=2077091 RepID=A0A2S7SY13_9BACT|nr:phosphoglucosamine mutase [Flavipsychrobacter stenotrophus]PQJ11517.1 phosphoglucosamine mutase [Flavipsychrobacter stenotrophus]
MALIKSISGIRGTIGGTPGKSLTPIDVVKFTTAYGAWVASQGTNKKIVIGRDGRISGGMVRDLVVATLQGIGCDVVDLGLSTTPTVEMAVKMENAGGGIILTASHNPKQWNALKLLNHEGEFLNAAEGQWILDYAEKTEPTYAEIDNIGTQRNDDTYIQKHIDIILAHPLVDVAAIKAMNYSVVLDSVNSTGTISVPPLLRALGVNDITVINEEVTGHFAHNPEPLPENLVDLCNAVKEKKATLGIAVDPDVDRLCFVCEDGSLFGEEYTLVAVADYILSNKKGNTVSNLSSTRALQDVTEKHGGKYFPSAVGEVNVVKKMKENNAVIGGEGNGGIIVPELHYGRDALIGIALFLTHLAKKGLSVKALRNTYPNYFISKNKIDLPEGLNVKAIFEEIKKKYAAQPINTEDGLRIDFDKDWVHLRTSNTEPIIRVYSESKDEASANNVAQTIMTAIKELMAVTA